MKPILLITVGPTGSGKTSLIDASIKQLKSSGSWHKFLIDDYVENDATYKKQVVDILQDKIHEKLDLLIEPTPELYSEFGNAYFSVRKNLGCGRAGKGGCDAQFDEDIEKSLEANENIVFETTGTYYPAWLVEKTKGRYDVVLAYTLVNICELVKRNKTRAVQASRQFLSNPASFPAPRLPNVSATGPYRDSIIKMKQVVLDIIRNNCLLSYSPTLNREYCSPFSVSKILLFDNNKYPMRLLVELNREQPLSVEQFEKLLSDYMSTGDVCQ